ncbi:proline-rich protein 36-like [Dioscorea cayenensis subsp. rotundata]|uniref:Proline-rich protein 36-like n=1 Tax=Dioscorea cayennensis subsp. rotundata TaxID=55577 RepID=A0AB40B485_DIOCR|nr:proline-rich protein 36-like [Dioscorea cayenensis subsp. rotundata]
MLLRPIIIFLRPLPRLSQTTSSSLHSFTSNSNVYPDDPDPDPDPDPPLAPDLFPSPYHRSGSYTQGDATYLSLALSASDPTSVHRLLSRMRLHPHRPFPERLFFPLFPHLLSFQPTLSTPSTCSMKCIPPSTVPHRSLPQLHPLRPPLLPFLPPSRPPFYSRALRSLPLYLPQSPHLQPPPQSPLPFPFLPRPRHPPLSLPPLPRRLLVFHPHRRPLPL